MGKRDDDERGPGLDLGLLGIFKGIAMFMDLVSRMAREGRVEEVRTGEFRVPGAPEGTKGVYGFSVKLGTHGVPKVDTFGNIRDGNAGPRIEDVREPITDVFEEEEAVVAIFEMPGADERSVEVSVEGGGRRLSVSARGNKRRYEKTVELPAPIRASGVAWSLHNGMLEVRAKKAGRRRPGPRRAQEGLAGETPSDTV